MMGLVRTNGLLSPKFTLNILVDKGFEVWGQSLVPQQNVQIHGQDMCEHVLVMEHLVMSAPPRTVPAATVFFQSEGYTGLYSQQLCKSFICSTATFYTWYCHFLTFANLAAQCSFNLYTPVMRLNIISYFLVTHVSSSITFCNFCPLSIRLFCPFIIFQTSFCFILFCFTYLLVLII